MKNLISVPRRLLGVEVDSDGTTMQKRLHYGRTGYSEIIIHTNKGIYKITGCSQCHAVFWEKVGDDNKSGETTDKVEME